MSLTNRWVLMRNRNDGLLINPSGEGVACDWEYTRTLHLCDVFPVAGCSLLRRALRDYPIHLQDRPCFVNSRQCCSHHPIDESALPEVSFLIGHRGVERLPLLLCTLRSIAAQTQNRFECIVIEQSAVSEIHDALPSWVRYQHQPVDAGIPYNRSATFNLAAKSARAPLLIFHDNDLVIPTCYSKEALVRFKQGCEVINLKRFIFYLGKAPIADLSDFMVADRLPVDTVLQNTTGGGSIVISAAAFHEIGGFDEDFVGWGGEDVEFWDRCQSRKVWHYTYLPLIHLWHSPQPGKRAVRGLGALTAELAEQRMALPVEMRISELRRRGKGTTCWKGKSAQ